MASLQELLAHQAALDRQIQEAKRATRDEALARIRKLMADSGLTVADVTAASGRKTATGTASDRPKKKVEAKYRHPATGEAWTGRGLKPKWLSAELANGRSIADFAV